jgi:uncharacterized protein (TIGR04255 family)
MQFENFPHPPIQEALIDFRVGYPAVPNRDVMEHLKPLLADNYPVQSEIVQLTATIAYNDGVGSANQVSSFGGIRFESSERGFVFQAQVSGFTVSKLKPYGNWTELLDETKKLWAIYSRVLTPISIERIACRYINRIEVNSGHFDFNDYLTTAPNVPEKLPQGVSRYLTQMEIPVPDAKATVIITQALEGVSDAPPAFLLDIDAFKVASYAIEENTLWADLEMLRTLKNQFFFEYVTEKTKALFR